jgi:hypothetical protein
MDEVELRNAEALAAELARTRSEFETRIRHVENEVVMMRALLEGMMQTVQVALHEVRGSRSTEEDR